MTDVINPRRRLLSAIAEYVSGTRSADSLSQAAAEVVAHDDEPPDSVVHLAAGVTSKSYDELCPIARAAVRALGYPELTPTFTSLVLALDLAREVASGRTPAGPGASQLWEVGRETAEGADQFGAFAELADEWETNLPKRGEIESEIRDAAAKLVSEVPLR